MGSLSDFAEATILDHLLGTTEFDRTLQELWVGLSTITILDDMAGDTCGETTGTAYLRVEVTTWNAAVGTRVTKNTEPIVFPEALTGTAWGEITDWFISDAETVQTGNIIAFGAFDSAKTIGTGDDASIAADSLTITVDANGMSNFCASGILDHIFLNTEFTYTTEIFVGLATAAVIDANSCDDVTEVSGSGYARKQQDNWNATDATGAGDSENTQAITFTQASASWGTVTHFFLTPATTGAGEILFHGAVGVEKDVGDGDTVQFDADTLTISLD